MKIPLLSAFLERAGRRRRRRIVRGHHALKASGRLALIVELKEALVNAHFDAEAKQASGRIFGAGRKDAEKIIRQYIFYRVGGLNLNAALLEALGGGGAVVHPLPARWRHIIREHGFRVDGFRCMIHWHAYVAFFYVCGLCSFLARVFAGFREALRPAFVPLGSYAYFDSLVPGTLPQPAADGRSHDILSWYLQWPERAANLDTLAHSVRSVPAGTVRGVRVQPFAHPIRPLARGGDVLRFLVWGLAAGGTATVDLVRGRWWNALLLHEAVKAAQLRLTDPALVARDYLFPNSVYLYRPLWSYEAERHGARIIFYFYSTNCESFKRPDGYPIQANIWTAMNWPHYLVWDEPQAEFVRRAVGTDAQIRVVGPIWFHSSATEMPKLPPETVAVFDVQPFRHAHYAGQGVDLDYHTPETVNQFLADIAVSVRERGMKFALKRKRKIGRLAHPAYLRLLTQLDGAPNFISVDSDTAAQRVIEQAVAVISFPFSSTGLLGRALGKPSIFYDPHGIVQKDDRAAHGIEIITGREELARWLSSVAAGTSNSANHRGLETAMADKHGVETR